MIPDFPSTSQLPLLLKIEPYTNPPTTHAPEVPTCYPSCKHCPPTHFQDYVFLTVTEEHNQCQDHPYTTVNISLVDLAIEDKYMMLHVCHYDMA